jgi:hypothetical protein
MIMSGFLAKRPPKIDLQEKTFFSHYSRGRAGHHLQPGLLETLDNPRKKNKINSHRTTDRLRHDAVPYRTGSDQIRSGKDNHYEKHIKNCSIAAGHLPGRRGIRRLLR